MDFQRRAALPRMAQLGIHADLLRGLDVPSEVPWLGLSTSVFQEFDHMKVNSGVRLVEAETHIKSSQSLVTFWAFKQGQSDKW